MTKKIRTIYDLAELAGVSAATVSRALAGKDLVSPKTAERIRALAQAHEFTPSALARNLRIQRRGAIGVVIPLGHERAQHISDPFFMAMIGGLADELTERGFDLILSRVLPDRQNWLRELIDGDRVDGVIVIGQSDQSAILDEVAEKYLPIVAWGGFSQGQIHCSVGTDNFLGGKIAVRHLIDRGCRKIGFFGNPDALEIAQRLEGARAAVANAKSGVTLDEVPTHLAVDLNPSEITEFFDTSSEMPDGIFAASDVIAVTIIQVLSSRGIAIPDRIKIVGFDDLPIARGVLPPLTTVRQDINAGAVQLVDLLLKRIEGKATGSVILNPELIIRGTT